MGCIGKFIVFKRLFFFCLVVLSLVGVDFCLFLGGVGVKWYYKESFIREKIN